ncbi:MFS transporter [Halalkalirubrum salinum]|uniref:MFS transporter n=1 Tax=Halalkalirubrum salinum TaxID=2563889 RepID=UPI0010FB9809|nr:MFS transporter [Halalkalirubrum salinum]
MNADDRRLILFTSGAHGLVHTYELSIPILMTVWLVEFSTTAALLGGLVTVGYGLFGVGALPGGVLVDRFGSKPLIIACLFGMAGSFVVMSLSPSLLLIGVAVALWGAAASVYHPAGLALLSKSVDRPGIALGYHGMGGNVGIALGPLVTALLLLRFDWQLVAAALAIPAIGAAVYGLTVDLNKTPPSGVAADGGDDNTTADTETTRDSNSNSSSDSEDTSKGEVSLSTIVSDTRILLTGGFVLVLLIVTLNGLYYRAFLTFLPDLLGDFLDGLVTLQLVDPESPYAEEFDLARYLYVGILMVGIGGQYIGGQVADRIAPERGLAYVLGTLAVLALLFVPATASVWTFLAVSLLLGIALFSVQPLSQTTVAAYSNPDARGLSFGYTYLAIFGVGALGAGLAGTVLTIASVQVLFLVLAAIAAMAALISFVLLRSGTRVS